MKPTPKFARRALVLCAATMFATAAWSGLRLDTGFDGDGIARIDFGANVDSPRDIALQSDGKTVLAGLSRQGSGTTFDYVALTRLNSDGSLDGSFGDNGRVTTLPGSPAGFGGAEARSVLIQPDGKIVVAGGYNDNSGSGRQIVVLRYNSDGTLDSSFGAAGQAILSASAVGASDARAEAIALDADGRLVLAGAGRFSPNSNADYAFVGRLTASGAIDSSFGSAGFYSLQPVAGLPTIFNALLVLADGSLIAGGGNEDLLLVKLDAAGAPVANFGTEGVARINVSTYDFSGTTLNSADQIEGLALLPDGRLLAAGYVNTLSSSGRPQYNTLIARLTAAGAVDSSFGSNGYFRKSGSSIPAYDIVALATGEMVVAGLGLPGLQVAADGLSSAALSGASEFQSVNALALDSMGRVYGAGEVPVSGPDYQFGALRIGVTALGGGSTDTVPDAFHFTDVSNVARATVQSSNTITVAGINAATPITVTGGSYRIGNGAFTSSAGTVNNGDRIQVSHTSSAEYSTTTDTTLSIGGVSDTYTSSTEAPPASDTTPDAFGFEPVSDAVAGTTVTSGAVTITGIDAAAPVMITGGEYAIADGAFTAASGTIANGQSVRVRQLAPAAGTTATVTLTIGGVAGQFLVSSAAQASTQLTGRDGRVIGLSASAGSFTSISAAAQPANAPTGLSFPSGFVSYRLGGLTPGQSLTLTVTLPAGESPTQLIKCGSAGCAAYPATITGNVVSFSLTDGGAGDEDGLANGEIVDPFGAGTPSESSVSTNTEGGTFGGLLLVPLAGWLALRRRRPGC